MSVQSSISFYGVSGLEFSSLAFKLNMFWEMRLPLSLLIRKQTTHSGREYSSNNKIKLENAGLSNVCIHYQLFVNSLNETKFNK